MRYSVMLAKDSPLLPKVDAVLSTLKAEGFIAKLHQTWFGVPAEASTSTVMKAEIPKP
jgi:polar amino acid transport system substrate-binding protein